MRAITRIVLTGGPCAGKSSAMSKLQHHFEKEGYAVGIVPEAATILIRGGLDFALAKKEHEQAAAQAAVIDLQEALEIGILAGLLMYGKPVILLCDRGFMDNAAYCSTEVWKQLILSQHDRGGESAFHQRYDHVIHLQSAACGASDYYVNNSERRETPEQAMVLDYKTFSAWSKHHSHHVIDNSTGFNLKLERVVQLVSKLLTEDERKKKTEENLKAFFRGKITREPGEEKEMEKLYEGNAPGGTIPD